MGTGSICGPLATCKGVSSGTGRPLVDSTLEALDFPGCMPPQRSGPRKRPHPSAIHPREIAQGGSKPGKVTLGHEEPGDTVLNDERNVSVDGGNHRESLRLRLENDRRMPALGVALGGGSTRLEQCIRSTEQPGKFGVRSRTSEGHCVLLSQAVPKEFECAAVWSVADDLKTNR